MRGQDDGLACANEVAGGADDFCVCSSDAADGLAIVWVAEDDRAGHKSRVCGAEHRGAVVDELASLTVVIVVRGLFRANMMLTTYE